MAQRMSLPTATVRRLLHPQSSSRLPRRPFHTTSTLAGNSFFDLTRLSASRESQHLSKEKGRPRTDFAPHLDLIKSSEVAPFVTKSDAVEKNKDRARKQKEPYITQDVVDRSIREQRVFTYLIKEVVRIEAAIEDLKKAEMGGHATNRVSSTEEAGGVKANKRLDAEDHIPPQEIDKVAAESTNVAYMNKKLIQASATLHETLQARLLPDRARDTAGGSASNTQPVDTARTDRLIASLIAQLEASKSSGENKEAVDRTVKQPKNSSDRIAMVLALVSLSGLVWMTSRLWTLSAERKNMLARLQESPPPIFAIPQGSMEPPAQEEQPSLRSGEKFRDEEAELSRTAPSSGLKAWFWAS
ncbi:MAG: hypothetical protein Q9168_003290 [Polycauliona sp. 1 TL-2023]